MIKDERTNERTNETRRDETRCSEREKALSAPGISKRNIVESANVAIVNKEEGEE